MLIERLSDIERINGLEDKFQKITGVEPFNVSSWTVSEGFKKKFLQCFRPPSPGNAVDYVYTYSFTEELRNRALIKLGVRAEDVDAAMLLVLPNNTIAIVNTVNLLKLSGYQKVCIVNPAYFSVSQTLRSMEIPFSIVSMERHDGKYSLPLDQIRSSGCDVVWITIPVFSTGVYLETAEINKIMTLLKDGYFVVADESFALHGRELIRNIGIHRNFLTIYSPHKSISCNGIKFSGIITSGEYEDVLEQWVDVLCGNLPLSSHIALHHFLSDNYDECCEMFQEEMETAKRAIQPLLKGKHHTTDWKSVGSLLTLYFDNVPFTHTKTDAFFIDLMKNTCSSILPGWLNGFGADTNLCFRVNLALDGSYLRNALARIVRYFESL